MAISAGEIQAILSLKDEMSAKLQNIDKTMGGLVGMAGKVASAFGVTFAISEVVKFGKDILDDADALTKLHDKTGISMQGLQKLRIAGDDAGNSLEQLTSAVNMLQKRMINDRDSVVPALAQLGLNLDVIKQMAPDKQFMAIGDAISKISDPAERVALAVKLFGRSGAENLPTLIRGFGDLKDATVGMSDGSIKALDRLGDAIGRWWRATKAGVGEVAGAFARDIFQGLDQWKILLGKSPDLPQSKPLAFVVEKGAELSALDLWDAERKLTDSGAALLAVHKAAADAAATYNKEVEQLVSTIQGYNKADLQMLDALDRVAHTGLVAGTDEANHFVKALDELRASGVRIPPILDAIAGGLRATLKSTEPAILANSAFNIGLIDTTGMAQRGADNVHNLASSFNEVAKGMSIAGDELGSVTIPAFGMLPQVVPQATQAIKDATTATLSFGQSLKGGLMANLQAVPAMIASAFTGGGGLMGAIQGIGSMIGSTLGKTVGEGISTAISGIGSLAGPIGAAIGGLAGSLVGWVAGLFGVSEEVKKARGELDQFQQSINATLTATQLQESGNVQWKNDLIAVRDAFLATGRSAAEAEAVVQAMWDTDNPARMKAAIDDVSAALNEVSADQKRANELISEYGITIDQLGQKWRDQQLSEQANGLMNDFRIMIGVLGVDMTNAIGLMSGKFSDYVNTAIRTGTEVPAAMRPILDQMIEQGALLDSNGVAFTSLESTGLSFADTLTQGFDRVVDRLNILLSGLGLIPPAVGDVANAVGGVDTELNRTNWGGWASDAVYAANMAYDAINAVSFGFSPGGIKEIPIQFAHATDAAFIFADVMSTEMYGAKLAIDDVALSTIRADTLIVGWYDRLGDTGPQTEAMRRLKYGIDTVADSVDGLLYGRSPGGVKDIPIRFDEAARSATRFAASVSRDIDYVGSTINNMTGALKGWHDRIGDTGPETEMFRRLAAGFDDAAGRADAFAGHIDRVKASVDGLSAALGYMIDGRFDTGPQTLAQTWRGTPMTRAGWAGGQASGGDYMVTSPTMFMAGEAGPERATFSPGGGPADDGALKEMKSEIQGLRADLRHRAKRQASETFLALRDALLQAGRS